VQDAVRCVYGILQLLFLPSSPTADAA